MRHKIHPAAREAIKNIWLYTQQTWGEDQANAYIRGLYDAVQQVAENKMLWRPVPHQHAEGVFFTRYKHHYIFFRELSRGRLGVVSVLHEKMNIPIRLKNDIEQD